MSARYLGRDAVTGAVETFDYDDATDTVTIGRRSADMQRILDLNKQQANHTTPKGDMVLAARIPIDVQYIWLQQYGIRAWDKNHWPGVRRLLNSSDWRYLRTSEIII